jgi:hypothetical protein
MKYTVHDVLGGRRMVRERGNVWVMAKEAGR